MFFNNHLINELNLDVDEIVIHLVWRHFHLDRKDIKIAIQTHTRTRFIVFIYFCLFVCVFALRKLNHINILLINFLLFLNFYSLYHYTVRKRLIKNNTNCTLILDPYIDILYIFIFIFLN